MKDNSGKIILSLLAGATAGVVAGLLLAPETGEETRAGLRDSAGRFSDDLSKLFKEGLTRLNDLKSGGITAAHAPDKSAADSLLNDLTPATGSDNAGSGSDARHGEV